MTQHDAAPHRRRDRTTIEDVAAAAGVSVATVSRALRGLPNVAISTRERVAAIAEQLAYRPDPTASRLATGRTLSVAVAVPVLNGWYFANVVAGVEAMCAEAGYDTVVLGVSSSEQRERLIHDTGGIHRRVDGIVLIDVAYSDQELRTLAAHGLDVVTVGPRSELFPSVGIDDVEVGRIATQHLIELGHERIGVIDGQPHDPLEFVVPRRRAEGHQLACQAAGIDIDRSLRESGNFSISGGGEALHALLARSDPPTAIFAMSDEMAFGALAAARSMGVDVPGELSVIGVDDHEMSVVVGLTTVRQDVIDHGARAARVLLDRLDGGARIPLRIDDTVELVVRDTTGPPPARRTG
jgi:DNA-binding LacI/PurR family transcriptional regulator